ncbi:DNA mismatch repair protein MutS [Terrilactibacillus sp. BCM23-1]|uniref:DNA mismatch repair protein MutS n=1 Tax=Terrilactibacillus tamarindi TaxID=2599694 RepID=A0A6N8CUU1_9BACI|nr:DNA mismatch repair protein MutS [Terrilactibacillus tamarindi]MTT32895.1 DNA mismatch repair protein MutS [Terrilactibacillus tamarindi]
MAYTPMIQQYLKVKADYKDAFLFFRLGDFYEMFFEDALKASKELEIALTARDGGVKEKIPMCGVPYHAAKQYIKVLIEKGYKVAICEQVEDPKTAKGVVKREVIQVITPGTIMDDQSLKPKQNNYLGSITQTDARQIGFVVSDLTTGEIRVTLLQDFNSLRQEILTYGIKELIVAPDEDQNLTRDLDLDVTLSYENNVAVPTSLEYLIEPLSQSVLKETVSRLLNYLIRTQKRSLDHLQKAEHYYVNDTMLLDSNSKRNLELTQTIRDHKTYGSLVWLLDETKTAMGGRKLKQWIEKPLLNQDEIEERLSCVEALIKHFFERDAIREALDNVYDMERLVGRVSFGNVNPRELVQLKRSLHEIPVLKDILKNVDEQSLKTLGEKMDSCQEVYELIQRAITDEPPLSTTEGNMIRDGYNETLDQYRHVSRNGKQWISELERKERETTGIKSLKIGYNKVFGYYIEVTKANIKYLPDGLYERKQTLANAERYITPELKEKERLILEAESNQMDLEYTLFSELRLKVKTYTSRLQKLAKFISHLDVLQSFAVVSEANRYVRPQFSHDRTLKIEECRHPVIEKVMKNNEFVANDVVMEEECHILLITGPNMGGKSTFMRQTALCAIMAQIGCFVPATQATLPIFDQIFTRIGATDDLVSGQSTFMMEMLEAQYALTHATQDSLILLDEIGRGTSTYDGIALAQAIVEHIHHHISCKTLFSTHYHELTFLDQTLPNLINVHVQAVEENGHVVFLHKVKRGQADKSYGIHVAELAGLPHSLLDRATTILADLEEKKPEKIMDENQHELTSNDDVNEEAAISIEQSQVEEESEQLNFFPDQTTSKPKNQSYSKREEDVIQTLKNLELMMMTPMDAMNQLFLLQKKLK